MAAGVAAGVAVSPLEEQAAVGSASAPDWARAPDFDALNRYGWTFCDEWTVDEN